MLRLLFGALLFWALLIAVVFLKQFSEMGAAVIGASLPAWLWLPYTTAGSFFEFTLRPEDKATLLAGLGGTILGGLISWAIARQTAAEARATARENHRQSEKSNALKAVIKVAQLANNIYTIHRAIERPIAEARATGDYRIAIWPFLRPSTHVHSEINFAVDDLMSFTFAGKSNIIQEMIMLSSRHNTLSEAYSTYCRKREEFQQFSEPFSRYDHATGQHETVLRGEASIRAEMKIFELDSLSKELRASATEYNEHAKATCALVDKFAQKRYAGTGGFIKLEPVEDMTTAKDAASAQLQARKSPGYWKEGRRHPRSRILRWAE